MIGARLLKVAAPYIADEFVIIVLSILFSQVNGKKQKLPSFLKMVQMKKLISITPYQLCLFCLKFLKSMYESLSEFLHTYLLHKNSLASEPNIHLKLLFLGMTAIDSTW